MKRICACLLCLTLLLGMAPAIAAPENLFAAENNVHRYPDSMTVVGDTLYALLETGEGVRLAWWREGMAQAECAATELTQGRHHDREALTEEDMRYAVSYLFSDGQRLMSMNLATGLVFAMDVQEGEIVFSDVVQVADTEVFYTADEEYAYPLDASDVFATDGVLYYLATTWDSRGEREVRCCAVSLTDGSMRMIPAEHVLALCPYKDGKLLAVTLDEQQMLDERTGKVRNPDLCVLDPATGSMEKVNSFPYYGVEQVLYSPELDAALYFENSRIMGMAGLTEPRQYGYMPIDWPNGAVLLDGTTLVACNYEQTLVRTLSAAFSADEYVTVYNGWMDAGTQLFAQRYPDVPVYFATEYYETVEQLNQAMVSGEDALDVLQMGTSYSSFFTLMEKGYCADLSGDAELMSMAQRLHPVFRDALMKDGKLYAVPVSAYSFGWAYSPDVLAEIGMTEADMPTDLIALCEMITRWNDGMMDDYPEYCLIEGVTDTRAFMFERMLEDYTHWCEAEGRELSFDTPEFRRLMAALENMRCDEMDRVYAQDEQTGEVYRQGILMYGYTVVGDFSWLMEGYQTWMDIIPMTLTPETEFFTAVSMEVAFINPRSRHTDAALTLLKCRMEAMEAEQVRVFFADATEPVENPWYQENVQAYQQELDALTAQLETADEGEKSYIEDGIESYRLMIQDQEQYRWNITADAVTRYQQEVVPAILVAAPSPFGDAGGEEMESLTKRYRDGQITLDQFIREADSKLWMMRMENQ